MIIKEQIEARGVRDIAASSEARVLAAGVTDGQPVVWIDEPRMDDRDGRLIVLSLFTGDDSPQRVDGLGTHLVHLDTIQNNGIVVHVYVPAGRVKL